MFSASHLAEGELGFERCELLPREALVLVVRPGHSQDQPGGLGPPAGVEVGELDGGRHAGGGGGGQGLGKEAGLGLAYLLCNTTLHCVTVTL